MEKVETFIEKGRLFFKDTQGKIYTTKNFCGGGYYTDMTLEELKKESES